MKIRSVLTASLLAAFSTLASAHPVARGDGLHARIDRGVHRGTLTQHEAQRLDRRVHALRAEKQYMLRDGHLSVSEREELRRDRKRLERDIHRENHDRQHRRLRHG